MFIRNLPTLTLLVIAAGLIGSNAWRFSTAEPKIAMSEHLNFLPEPAVARAMSLGHTNTLAKLRWIDSFKYFQYQIDARDDRVAGGERGGFERLYDMLVGMDPAFDQFYYHASLTLSGILQDHGGALRFLVLGVEENPHDPLMWVNLLAHLKAFFDLEEQNPQQMEHLLHAWASVMPTEELRSMPEMWMASLARRQDRGDAQIDYWINRLMQTTAGSQEERLVESVLREQIARWHCNLLQNLTADVSDERLSGQSLDLAAIPSNVLASYGPVTAAGRIRHDPYGGIYYADGDGQVRSQGLEVWKLQRLLDDHRDITEALQAVSGVRLSEDGSEVVIQEGASPWQFRDSE